MEQSPKKRKKSDILYQLMDEMVGGYGPLLREKFNSEVLPRTTDGER